MPMTNYLQNAVLNASLRNVTYTQTANVYSALYSVAPTASTSGTEITGNGYSRQLTTFASANAGVCTSNVAVNFTATGNAYPTVVAFGVVDASTSGNILYYKNITGRNVKAGDTLTFDSGAITITLT
jgi:hypothetical protein